MALKELGLGSVEASFRDTFTSLETDGSKWNITSSGTPALITTDGNTAGSSHVTLSLDPLASVDSRTSIESVSSFKMPFEYYFGASMSNRVDGAWFSVNLLSTESLLTAPASINISSISQSTTTLSITTATAHGLLPGDLISINGLADSRFNYPYVTVATIPTPTTLTSTASPFGNLPSVTGGPFATGTIKRIDPLENYRNGCGLVLNNTSATNGSFYARVDGHTAVPSGSTSGSHQLSIGSTTSINIATATGRAYSFDPSTIYAIFQNPESLQFADMGRDNSSSVYSSRQKRNFAIPDETKEYKIRCSAASFASTPYPVAKIVSAVKTGTTTATITTDVAHGLTTSDFVTIYGTRDQTNFPNLTAATQVASIVDADTFTIIMGGAVTATTYSGYVSRAQGGRLQPGAISQAIQSAVVTTTDIQLTGNASWSGLSVGDYVNIHGCRDNVSGASMGLDGVFRVKDIVTTVLTLETITDVYGAVATALPAAIGSTNCGGGILRRTDLRLHYMRLTQHTRHFIEPPTQRPDTSLSQSVVITNTPQVTVSSGTINTIDRASLSYPALVADVASAAITTTTTTSAISPTAGTSFQVNIPVTAVSGTTPTMDVDIEESDDSGTNWFKVYSFPRITATGIYRSPRLAATGNRIRYVQTLTGTSPSFTRSINRMQCATSEAQFRQLINRTVNVNLLNSTTNFIIVSGCTRMQMVVNLGAITTTAPVFQMEGSDDNGATWYGVGGSLTGSASGTVQLTVVDFSSQLLRVRVTTAGVGATAGYVLLKGFA